MRLQIQLKKNLTQFNFLESTIYERNDLTNLIKQEDRFMVRQGDLIITNYYIDNYRMKGLGKALLDYEGTDYKGILTFANSHFVIPQNDKTILIHPEHGITIIPENIKSLEFYTFSDARD
jgi:hypothetical protein